MDANRYSSLKFSIIDILFLFLSFSYYFFFFLVQSLPQIKMLAKYGLVYQLLSQSFRMWVYVPVSYLLNSITGI